MARVEPFRALRYDLSRAGALDALIAPPYDVISSEGRDELAARSPRNIVHLTLAADEADAGPLLRAWQEEGTLAVDDTPALWFVVQEFTGPDGVRRERAGIVAAVGVEPYENRVVLPHERTHSGPKESRLRVLRATRTQLEPIFLLYEDPEGRPRKALAPHVTGEPTLVAADRDSVSKLWRVDDPAAVAAVRDALAAAQLLIADGHHRYETAVAFHAEDGTPGSALTFAVLVNTVGEGLEIFATHRVVKQKPSLHGLHLEAWEGSPASALAEVCALPPHHPAFVVHTREGTWIATDQTSSATDVARLDALGLGERTYTPVLDEAVAAVAAGEAGAAFLLRPTRIEQVQESCQRGEVMPQKSTYFYPKLHSGLLLFPLG